MRTALLEIFDRNGFIHLFIIAIVVTCCILCGLWNALLYPVILLVLELLNYVGGLSVFNPEKRIQRGYVVSAFFNDSLFGQGIDYGFNFYNGDYSKSRVKAQSDKFEYASKQLNLEPGMWVIDIGCGCGDWLDYLHSKGIHILSSPKTKHSTAKIIAGRRELSGTRVPSGCGNLTKKILKILICCIGG